MNDCRLGVQTGELQKARVNRTPCRARASSRGVACRGSPSTPSVPPRWSSATRIRRFGRLGPAPRAVAAFAPGRSARTGPRARVGPEHDHQREQPEPEDGPRDPRPRPRLEVRRSLVRALVDSRRRLARPPVRSARPTQPGIGPLASRRSGPPFGSRLNERPEKSNPSSRTNLGPDRPPVPPTRSKRTETASRWRTRQTGSAASRRARPRSGRTQTRRDRVAVADGVPVGPALDRVEVAEDAGLAEQLEAVVDERPPRRAALGLDQAAPVLFVEEPGARPASGSSAGRAESGQCAGSKPPKRRPRRDRDAPARARPAPARPTSRAAPSASRRRA